MHPYFTIEHADQRRAGLVHPSDVRSIRRWWQKRPAGPALRLVPALAPTTPGTNDDLRVA